MIFGGTQNEAFQLSKSMHGKLLIFCMKLQQQKGLELNKIIFCEKIFLKVFGPKGA